MNTQNLNYSYKHFNFEKLPSQNAVVIIIIT